MSEKDEMYMRYYTKIKIVKTETFEINPEFSLCDVLVCYHGDNRNNTSIKKSVIENALFSIYGIPIVGEWVYKLDGTDKKSWGSHGGKIIIDDRNVTFEITTKPYGFVPRDAMENAEWVEVLEKDGVTRHEYLKLSGCILWSGLYEECCSILEESFGQSMEIGIENFLTRDDGIVDIKKLYFKALCILGNDIEPCFEGASIGRHYSNDITGEFQKMIEFYSNYRGNKEEKKMEVLDRVKMALSGIHREGTEEDRFALLNADEKFAYCIDRDTYKGCAIPYSIEEDEVSFNISEMEERYIAVGEVENTYSFADEMETVVSKAIESYESKAVEDLKAECEGIEGKYNELFALHTTEHEELEKYKQLEAEQIRQAHIEAVDAKIEEYAEAFGRYSKFLLYRGNVDYNKSIDEVETDLKIMLGEYKKDSKSSGKKKDINFNLSYSHLARPANPASERYGDIFQRVSK